MFSRLCLRFCYIISLQYRYNMLQASILYSPLVPSFLNGKRFYLFHKHFLFIFHVTAFYLSLLVIIQTLYYNGIHQMDMYHFGVDKIGTSYCIGSKKSIHASPQIAGLEPNLETLESYIQDFIKVTGQLLVGCFRLMGNSRVGQQLVKLSSCKPYSISPSSTDCSI